MSDRSSPAARARAVREALPEGGLFAGQEWRTAVAPFPLGESLVAELESLGRVLLQFYRAVNLLYRRSVEGKAPAWVAQVLDQGKPESLIALQRDAAFKNEVPRVIRPDVLLTAEGFAISELDSVPGGIGLTAWLNQTYSQSEIQNPKSEILGGADAAYDTLVEIQQLLQNGTSGLDALLAAVNNRVRFDAAQSLTVAEQLQARSNIGAVAATDVGNTDTDFVAVFVGALV